MEPRSLSAAFQRVSLSSFMVDGARSTFNFGGIMQFLLSGAALVMGSVRVRLPPATPSVIRVASSSSRLRRWRASCCSCCSRSSASSSGCRWASGVRRSRQLRQVLSAAGRLLMSAATTSGSRPPGSPASILRTRAGKTTTAPPSVSTIAAGRGLVQKTTSPGSVSRPAGYVGGEVQEVDVPRRVRCAGSSSSSRPEDPAARRLGVQVRSSSLLPLMYLRFPAVMQFLDGGDWPSC